MHSPKVTRRRALASFLTGLVGWVIPASSKAPAKFAQATASGELLSKGSTTFSYNGKGVGHSSIVNANYDTWYYEYDGFGRLTRVA